MKDVGLCIRLRFDSYVSLCMDIIPNVYFNKHPDGLQEFSFFVMCKIVTELQSSFCSIYCLQQRKEELVLHDHLGSLRLINSSTSCTC